MSTTWQWAKANPDAAARRIRELEREHAALKQRCEICEAAAVIDSYFSENRALRADQLRKILDHAYKLERENAALRASAVEVCAVARVWATVWGDKLSSESLGRFAELEQEILTKQEP